MKLSELKALLPALDTLSFGLAGGSFVPAHFHITEVGKVTRHFIDCGGTVREEQAASLQLWHAQDTAHRLEPQKLLGIIRLSEAKLGLPDLDVEVEYQGDTIGRYGLDFKEGRFILESKFTACLAQDACGVPAQKQQRPLAELKNTSCCGGAHC